MLHFALVSPFDELNLVGIKPLGGLFQVWNCKTNVSKPLGLGVPIVVFEVLILFSSPIVG